jgi:glycosyltransferase involved in cell wall biosynthesis
MTTPNDDRYDELKSGTVCMLDPALPTELAIGRGTSVLIKAWCSSNQRLRKAALIVDARERPTSIRHHLPPLGISEQIQTASGSLFWTLVNIGPCAEERDLEIAVRLRWAGGAEEFIRLGAVRLQPNVPPAGEPCRPQEVPAAEGPLVCICMTTYNPPLELFRRQVASIKAQTHTNWLCVIRDDCSDTDVSSAIEQEVRGDDRFAVYRNHRRLGFYHNFEACLALVPEEARFVALSDHDDYWHPDKLQALLDGFEDGTLLVYSDMNIVDRSSRLRWPTYWTTRLNNYTDLASLMIANTITGAASMFRRDLLSYALPFPQKVGEQFHDNWLGIVALGMGKVNYIDRPLYDYVQHDANVIGHAVPERERIFGLRLGLLGTLIQRRTEVFGRGQMNYFNEVLRIKLLGEILLMRAGPGDGIEILPTKKRALDRLRHLEWSPLGLCWLLFRGAPSAWRKTTTMGRESLFVLGLVWFYTSRFRH